MTRYNQTYDAELLEIIQKHPHNFVKVLKSKGVKSNSVDRTYLIDYMHHCTSQLVGDDKSRYKLKTLLFWALNKIESWNDERVRCIVCGSPLYGIDVKHVADGYNRYTCCKECERKLAQRTNMQNLQDRYGVENAFQLPSVKAKLDAKKDQMQHHRNDTKRKNNTFKTSKKEDDAYQILCSRFGEENILRQYHSDTYPFNCDFYVKPLDLYIECNFSWTHGGHWFDASNEDDVKKLNVWKDKRTQYYQNAIETWTVRDVKKRKCAEENKLNYLVFWKFDELKSIDL